MGALVQYRDLPGGPTKLELCDELSRYCMCTNCGMLSMSMLEDTNNHAFCETCLKERSFRHHSDHIYCKYESKNVSIFEMFDANHLITVIRDQSVVCPNPECKEIVTLQNLKEHYMRCQKTVTCSTCQHPVQTTEWSSHEENCNKQESAQMQPQGARPKQIRTEVGRAPSKQSPSVKVDSNQNNGSFNSMYPSIELQKAQKLTSGDPEEKVLCLYCGRNLKKRNMEDHVVKCAKAPQRCAYCEDDIKKEVLQSHQRECKKNPDNVHAQVPEKKKKAPNTQGACGFQAPGGESSSYAFVVKHGKHAGGNNSTGTSSQPKVHSQSSQVQCIQTQPRAASANAPATYQAAEKDHFKDANSEKDEFRHSGSCTCCCNQDACSCCDIDVCCCCDPDACCGPTTFWCFSSGSCCKFCDTEEFQKS